MANYKAQFMRYMGLQGIRYSDLNDTTVSVAFAGESAPSVSVLVSFDPDGNGYAEFGSYGIGSVKTDEKYANAIVLCNDLNKQCRWVKFFVDDDRNIVAKADAILDYGSSGSECLEIVNRMVGIIDSSYSQFMKLMWS